jgi:hypothetical protein
MMWSLSDDSDSEMFGVAWSHNRKNLTAISGTSEIGRAIRLVEPRARF